LVGLLGSVEAWREQVFLLLLWLIWRLVGGKKRPVEVPSEPIERSSGKLAMLTWHEVESTSIRAIGYDPEKDEAWVEFLTRSGSYVYFGVPAEVYAGLEEAESKGSYVNCVIKMYPYEYRGRWPN
jgi:hypothetical protein